MRQYYVLFSPSRQMTREAFTKTNGEIVPTTVFEVEARALYRLKGLPDRRYRSGYPNPFDKQMFIAKFRTLDVAKQEQENLREYCGETFEIRGWAKGAMTNDVYA